MVCDGVANVVIRLQESGFDPRKVGPDSWESRCPAHRSAECALPITRGRKDTHCNAIRFPVTGRRDEKTRTATPAAFQGAKYALSPNPLAARWLGSTANAMARQISLSRGRIFELRSGQASWPVSDCRACPFSPRGRDLLKEKRPHTERIEWERSRRASQKLLNSSAGLAERLTEERFPKERQERAR
jgi:hypothetical protein